MTSSANAQLQPDMPRGLDGWVRYICNQDMPVLGSTVLEIQRITDSDNSTAQTLGQVILQDAGMTARVLRLANSPHFNPSHKAVNTISRAIVVLGFDTVRNVAMSVGLIDALLQGGVRERVTALMARAFLAAVQARTLSCIVDPAVAEEVFIAALLYQVGDMAFWCLGGEAAERLDRLVNTPGTQPEAAQQALLGFRLRQLSLGLARHWQLTGLLLSVLQGDNPADERVRCVVLGHRLALALEQGWESHGAVEAIGACAAHVGQRVEDVRPLLHLAADEAAHIATIFGAADAGRLIPRAPGGGAMAAGTAAAAESAAAEPTAAHTDGAPAAAPVALKAPPPPDLQAQLSHLRELSALMCSDASPNQVLRLALEGIYHGLAMDRAVIALVQGNLVEAKLALGLGASSFSREFRFQRDRNGRDAIGEVMEHMRPVFIADSRAPESAHLMSDRVVTVVGHGPLMCVPLVVGARALGLIYADRRDGRGLSQEDWTAFQHFAQQAAIGLQLSLPRAERRS